MSLRTKTFLLVSGIASLIIVLVAGAALHFQEKSIRTTLLAGVDAFARASATQVGTFIHYSLQAANLIAAEVPTEAITLTGRRSDLYRYLAKMGRHIPSFDNGIFLLDRDGLFLADYPPHPELEGQSFAHRDYFKRALTSEHAVVAEPYISARTKRQVQTFAVPIRDDDGALLAVLGCSTDLLGTQGISSVVNQKYGETGYIYTFDRPTRLMITHPDKSRLLQRDVVPGANRLLDQAIEGFEGTGETVNSRGTKMLMGIYRVPQTTWLLAAQIPEEEALAPFEETKRIIASIALITWLIAVALSLWSADHIVRSIRRLQGKALSLYADVQRLENPAPGEDRRAHDHASVPADEIGALEHAFDALATRVDHKVAALHQAVTDIRTTFDAVTLPLFRLDQSWCVVRCNRAAVDWLRQEEAEMLGRPLSALLFPGDVLPDSWPDERHPAEFVTSQETHWRSTLPMDDRHYEFSATGIVGDQQHPTGLVITVRDLTTDLRETEKMQELAFFDPLTGLPNRLLLADRLQQALITAQRQQQRVGVLFLDLDHFKQVNDVYGHDVGDALLKTVAARWGGCLRASDTLSRIGGDEFVVVLPGLTSVSNAVTTVERLIAALERPIEIGDVQVIAQTSIGVAVFPDHGVSAADLTKCADAAMYRAKRRGSNTYALADEGSGDARLTPVATTDPSSSPDPR